jgi:hypothetical protein
MHKPRPDRTRYRKPPRRHFIDPQDPGDDPEDDQPEDPINGPGEESK